MLFEPDQIKYKFAKTQTKGDPRLDRYKGGMIWCNNKWAYFKKVD